LKRQILSVASHDPSVKPSLWRPLRVPVFRNLLLANVVSDIGAFMQVVGAAWLMLSLRAGPMYVALIQTASALPYVLLALPAGAVGDIVDRRKLILSTEAWMAGVALLLTIVTITGKITPLLLLLLTFALSAGDAFETPTWRAVLPELVPKDDLPSASALNGIEFNFARAVGPALAGAVISLWGVGRAFLLNTLSFVAVISVIARWKRQPHKRTVPVETLTGATIAAVRFVRFAPALRAVILRSGVLMFFASGLLALLPSIARTARNTPFGYGFLLGCFGLGAVLGALAMQSMCKRWSTEQVLTASTLLFGVATMGAAELRFLPVLGVVMLVGGAAWIVFLSLYNVAVLNLSPDWVRARVSAVWMMVFQGAVAAGSATWGALATRVDVHHALLWAGAGTLGTAALRVFLPSPDLAVDVTPWNGWRAATIAASATTDLEDIGPVLVTVEYDIAPARASDFIKVMRRYGRIRRRDGAYEWGIFRDAEKENCYLETFLVHSWAEHLRQHARSIQSDRPLEERVRSCTRGEPKVRHLISAR
jgi:predicted MFS family arabinose efflux permease